MAVAILFIVAIALIFYAVTINIGRVAQIKAVVTASSNLAAAQLGSSAASWAQQLMQTHLAGNFKKCGLTGAFAALVGVFLAVVGLLLAIFTGGGSLALCIIGIVMASASLIIEAGPITTATTNAWNKQLWEIMDSDEVYVEQALQTALQNAATDGGKAGLIDDYTDLDGDRRFIGSTVGDGKDEVSRFAYLYQKRIHDMSANGSQHVAALDYIDRLTEFLFAGADGLGITDKPGVHCSPTVGDEFVIGNDNPPLVPSQCNPCCVPEEAEGETLRSPLCDTPGYEFSYATCGAATPYPGYPDVFDRAYEDPWNNYRSFREQVGHDDEHVGFNRRFLQASLNEDCEDPPTVDKLGHPNEIPQEAFGMHTGPSPFYFGDVDGYYPPDNNGSADIRDSVFAFFWQAKHFGVDLNSLMKTDYKYPECVWCDPADPENVFSDGDGSVDSDCDGDAGNDNDNGSKCSPCYPDMIVVNDIDGVRKPVAQLLLGQMAGIEYPDIAPGYLLDVLYETNYFVDGTTANVAGDPPLAVDNANEVVQTFKDIISDNAPISANIWIEGTDRYCDGDWPYEYPCFYEGEGVNTKRDKIDFAIYELDLFAAWAFELVFNNEFAASQLGHWNVEIQAQHARLQTVANALQSILTPLYAWREESYMTNEAWCVPSAPGLAPPDEQGTFGAGKLEDIVACLAWNTQEDVGMVDS
ncbi:MAG: hypothetical protein Q7T18_10830, partial [Sedimentisphaerales bacterium]|nr:hypothetical protein [Sedimentisphaerales bacterium]